MTREDYNFDLASSLRRTRGQRRGECAAGAVFAQVDTKTWGAQSSAVITNLDYLAVTNDKHGGQRGKLCVIYKEILATPKDKRSSGIVMK